MELEELNAERSKIETDLSSGTLTVGQITAASARFGELKDIIDEKELRWLELSEKV